MKSLAAALVEAQAKMPVVPKLAKANYGNYATLDSLIDKTRKVLNDHGLAIAQFPSETTTGQPGLRTVLVHADSGESLEATVPLLLNGKHDMQALGGAITYARRYGWAAVLGIANDEDDDGNRVSAPADGNRQSAATGAADAPAAPAPSTDGWTWPFGKHKGKTLADTDPGYLTWFLENSDKEDIKERVRAFQIGGELEAVGAFVVGDPNEGIPF